MSGIDIEREYGAIGERLHSVLADANKGLTISKKAYKIICQSLKDAYDEIPLLQIVIDIEIPGETQRDVGAKIPEGYVVPVSHPGDEREEYRQGMIVKQVRINQHKIDILNQALALGCKWAKEEQIKISDALLVKPRRKVPKTP